MCSDLNSMINIVHDEVKAAYEAGKLPARKKCCGRCAFRKGSPERADPYGWAMYVDGWKNHGHVFLCHEGIPGNREQKAGEPLRICAGYHATKNTSEERLMSLAEFGERQDSQNS